MKCNSTSACTAREFAFIVNKVITHKIQLNKELFTIQTNTECSHSTLQYLDQYLHCLGTITHKNVIVDSLLHIGLVQEGGIESLQEVGGTCGAVHHVMLCPNHQLMEEVLHLIEQVPW